MTQALSTPPAADAPPLVRFYQLSQRSLEQTLPDLAEKVLEKGQRLLILAATADRVRTLDDQLWTEKPDSFLPHGSASTSKNPAQEPIWLATLEECQEANPNNADVLLLVDSADAPMVARFSMTLVLFDGRHEESLLAARQAWKSHSAAGRRVEYWQQQGSGRWEKVLSAADRLAAGQVRLTRGVEPTERR